MVLNRTPKKYSKPQLKEMRNKVIAVHAVFLSYKREKEKKIEGLIQKEEEVDKQMSRNLSLVKEIADIIYDKLLPKDLNIMRKILADPVIMKDLKLEALEEKSDPNKYVTTFRVTDKRPNLEGDNAVTLKKTIALKHTTSRLLQELTHDQAENVDKMRLEEGLDDNDCDIDSKPAWRN
jgi:hypothetical protein